MALSTPSQSPAVIVREIDLTGGVPNVQSTTGAIVGNFNWGPVSQRVAISNESELASTFGTPSSSNAVDYLSASAFLQYSGSLVVVRAAHTTAENSAVTTSNGAPTTPIKVLNDADFDAQESGIDDSVSTIAKYPGVLGNSLTVSYVTANQTQFDGWDYSGEFDRAPGTSVSAEAIGASNDEIHLVVVDRTGLITGTPGAVVERFANLSVATDAKNDQGQSVYAPTVINKGSSYIKFINFDSDVVTAGGGASLAPEVNYDAANTETFNLVGGEDGTLIGQAEYTIGYDLFEDKDQVEIDFLIAPSLNDQTDHVALVNGLVTIANARKDCVVTASPNRNAIVGVLSDATKNINVIATAKLFTRSSYLVVDNNFAKVYDKHNDKYVDIPTSAHVAGIMAATDFDRAAWFSPAGGRRGQILGITSLAYSPTKGQRDALYREGINPIANIPGSGTVLFGDKTFLGRVSAFDRINVRRLFLVLERAIGRAAEQVMFEFNDEFTRADFTNLVEPVLREVQGRRGITDFRVVCDETNNTAEVVDRNEFKADIFIKPARSINYVTLSFVAVRTGVDFEEVVGTV